MEQSPLTNLYPHGASSGFATRRRGSQAANIYANYLLSQNISRREAELRDAGLHTDHEMSDSGLAGECLRNMYPMLREIPQPPSLVRTLSSTTINAENDCIMAIAWELSQCPPAQTILGCTTDDTIALLHSAAFYYAYIQSGVITEQVRVKLFYSQH
jgi:hypothetical protein